MLLNVRMFILNCWLTLHGFGPSAAFKFQARVCADISCITNVTLVLIPFFLCLVFACLNMFLHFLGGFEQKLGSEGKGILKLNPPSMELSTKSMEPTLPYTTRHYLPLHFTTLHYTTLHNTTTTQLHSTTLNYTTLHYITLHSTRLHYTTLHYTTFHYTALHWMTLRHR